MHGGQNHVSEVSGNRAIHLFLGCKEQIVAACLVTHVAVRTHTHFMSRTRAPYGFVTHICALCTSDNNISCRHTLRSNLHTTLIFPYIFLNGFLLIEHALELLLFHINSFPPAFTTLEIFLCNRCSRVNRWKESKIIKAEPGTITSSGLANLFFFFQIGNYFKHT